MDLTILKVFLENPAWIGVLGTLAGGTLVGIFSLVSKRLERSSEDRSLLRSKLEDLHRAICKYAMTMDAALEVVDFSPKGTDLGRAVALETKKLLFEPLIEITSITYLYASGITSEIDDLSDLATELFVVAAFDIKNRRVDSKELKDAYSALSNGISEAKTAVEDLTFANRLIPGRRPMQFFRAAWSQAGRKAKRADKMAALTKERSRISDKTKQEPSPPSHPH